MSDVDIVVKTIDESSAAVAAMQAGFASLSAQMKELNQSADVTNHMLGAGGVGGIGGAAKQAVNPLTELRSGIDLARQGVDAIKGAFDSTVGSVVSYDDNIRRLSAATGISSEETSKLIDLTDNFGVSTSALMMAQKNLAREGYSLNIDTLKVLGTQYSELGTQAEKTTFLVEKFGKSGMQFAEMFDYGTAAMDRFYNGSADGMVRTAEQTRATLELSIAQKDLGDAWQGMVNKAVTPMVPEMTNGIKAATGELDILQKSLEKIFQGDFAGQRQLVSDYWKQRDSGTPADTGMPDIQRRLGPAAPSPEDLAAMASKYSEISMLTQQVGAQSAALADVQGSLQEKMAAVREELDKSISLGYHPAGTRMKELSANLEELSTQYRENEAAAQENTNKQVYNDYLKMNSSKEMTYALFQQQQELGVALGVFSEADAKTATKMYELRKSFEDGKISAEQFAASLKTVDDAAPSPTGQENAQAWMDQQDPEKPTGQQAAAPTPAAGTGQQNAQAWLEMQNQAKKVQDAAKTATTSMTSAFSTYSTTVQKQADAAKDKVQSLVDTLTSLGEFGTITIAVTGGGTGSGAPEYP